MSVQVLRAADRVAAAWKNGGGVTREIAVSPLGATTDAFDWRISVADVAVAGPFSAFLGVDRVLCVIAGEGLSLAIDGRAAVTLDQASAPLAFPGEAECRANLRAGPIRDLNVMVRRGAWRARVRRRSLDAGEELVCHAEVTLLLALDPVGMSLPSGVVQLAPEDAVLASKGSRVTMEAPTRLIFAEIDRAVPGGGWPNRLWDSP